MKHLGGTVSIKQHMRPICQKKPYICHVIKGGFTQQIILK